ncbi:restriction endonuclease [Rhizobium laguerreae]|uniref:restriction endonuclease n=1 Tax=Rhizobium laguerreae TaxID=1076926 RepID=UPI001441B330|nr:restriction endonuclease [Rhizobium laguerreae]
MLKTEDLSYVNLTSEILKNYTKRTPVVSGQFLRWFFENILRLDPQDADDACVDSSQDKGIDGLYVNDVTEIIHLVQVKTRQKENSTLGDPELKEFFGSIQQFKDEIAIQSVLAGNTSDKLKQAIRRTKLIDKVKSGYRVEGIFVSNIPANKDADDYVEGRPEITLYDAKEICSEYIDLGAVGGIKSDFKFNVADTEVIKYT